MAASTQERWSGAGSAWSGCFCTHTPLTSESMTKGGHFPYPVFHRPGWQALCGEGGGKRRGNSLPREGLPLCVAPYFATLGRGDMRGRSVVSHPNRTPEVVRGCRIRHGVYRAVCQCCVV